MDGERIERAVQRIEAALGRIATVADSYPPVSASGSGGDAKLREAASKALNEIDALIERLER